MEFVKYLLRDVCSRLSSGKNIKASEVLSEGPYPVFGGNGLRGYAKTSNFIGSCAIIGRQGAYCGNVRYFKGEAHMTEHAVVVQGNELADNYYLSALLSTMHLERLSGQSAQPGLAVGTLAQQEIELPSIEDQRRIANILSSLDRKIELNNKINAQLEEMAQTLFKHWFVDFGPFKDGKFVESELGMIPEGWRVGSIYDYVKVIYGAPYKSSLFNEKGEGLPLIRIRDLKDGNPQFYSPEILPNTEFVEIGDILAGMDAEFIPYIWKGEKGLLNQRVCKLAPKQDGISKLYVLYLMKPHLEFTQSYKTGTTVSHLGKSDIDKFISILPPIEVVREISKKLDAILFRICNIALENRKLSALRDTLLPKLMSGEINLEDYGGE